MKGRNDHSGPDPHQNGSERGDTNEPRDLLTAKDVARILAITPEALAQLRWRREGPPHIKIGRSVRYHPADVEAYIDERRMS